jgi:hypothetical protein
MQVCGAMSGCKKRERRSEAAHGGEHFERLEDVRREWAAWQAKQVADEEGARLDRALALQVA